MVVFLPAEDSSRLFERMTTGLHAIPVEDVPVTVPRPDARKHRLAPQGYDLVHFAFLLPNRIDTHVQLYIRVFMHARAQTYYTQARTYPLSDRHQRL